MRSFIDVLDTTMSINYYDEEFNCITKFQSVLFWWRFQCYPFDQATSKCLSALECVWWQAFLDMMLFIMMFSPLVWLLVYMTCCCHASGLDPCDSFLHNIFIPGGNSFNVLVKIFFLSWSWSLILIELWQQQ